MSPILEPQLCSAPMPPLRVPLTGRAKEGGCRRLTRCCFRIGLLLPGRLPEGGSCSHSSLSGNISLGPFLSLSLSNTWGSRTNPLVSHSNFAPRAHPEPLRDRSVLLRLFCEGPLRFECLEGRHCLYVGGGVRNFRVYCGCGLTRPLDRPSCSPANAARSDALPGGQCGPIQVGVGDVVAGRVA